MAEHGVDLKDPILQEEDEEEEGALVEEDDLDEHTTFSQVKHFTKSNGQAINGHLSHIPLRSSIKSPYDDDNNDLGEIVDDRDNSNIK